MRMRQPFAVRAHHAAAHPRRVDCPLELERVPLGHRLGDGFGFGLTSQQLQHARFQVRQAEMRQHPASILARPRLGDRNHRLVVLVDHRLEGAVWSGPLQIDRAAQAGGGVADVDCQPLRPAGLEPPEVADSHADTGEYGGTGLADAEARRKYRIRTADAHGVGRWRLEPTEGRAHAHHLFECRYHCAILHACRGHCAAAAGKGLHQGAAPSLSPCPCPHLSLSSDITAMLDVPWSQTMQWRVGDVSISKIVELETTGGSRFILPQATREAVLPISWLIPHFSDQDGRLKMSIHALMVEAPGRRIIVDTCLGNDKKDRRIPTWNDRQGRFLDDLAAAGFPPETIDTVLCTHLHVDHVGWNTMLVNGQWLPTFPNARYLFGRVEYEH